VVGIVIVTHSRELADSVKTLAGEMLRQEVPIAAAGGVDDENHPFGTDVQKIISAIESVYSDHGVLVLMDMGSALLSAQTAIDFLNDELKGNVLLCEAPLVEGAVAAAVSAEGGGTLEEVSREARASLRVKREQLKGETKEEAMQRTEPRSPSPGKVESRRVTVVNPLGIHARPAAALVSTASRFKSSITIARTDGAKAPVSARSISGVSLLGARQGDELELTAAGSDARAALDELEALVKGGFGERNHTEEQQPVEASSTVGGGHGTLSGIGASPGVAIGPAIVYKPRINAMPVREAVNPGNEWERFIAALDGVKQKLEEMIDVVSVGAGEAQASIFSAHRLVLEDDALLEHIRKQVYEEMMSAEQAWTASIDGLLTLYNGLESSYQRERGKDIEDLRWQVLNKLAGVQSHHFDVDSDSIVIATDLAPSDVALLDSSKVLGLCAAYGGLNSHSAILARALGIPAVLGLGPGILRISEDTTIAMDGKEGTVWIDPEHVEVFASRRARWIKHKSGPSAVIGEAVATADGIRLHVCGNISSVAEARRAMEMGADGIGVLRTEFLFMHRPEAPSEEEQVEIYRTIAETMKGKGLVIRTLDAGGDKPLPYVSMKGELNPFLGVRGIRLLLEHPELLKTQLRAVLRAGAESDVSVLLPMISTIEEVRQVKEYLEQARRELRDSHHAFSRDLKLGIMIEVPAAALIAAHLAREVDFMSIGTNDLSQYLFSADRTSSRVSALCDSLHPSLLHLIERTAGACHDAGICAGVCGEMAADMGALPILLGLGIEELSMNPYAIPRIKEAVLKLDTRDAACLAAEALKLEDGLKVRRLVSERLGTGCGEADAG
jgi:phosphocarrier protein FPr